MKPLTSGNFANEHLSRIVPAYFYITTRERNAWRGTESQQYQGEASLRCTLSDAKKVAEEWRARGSTFTIQQVPGLHLLSEWTDLALVEFHSDDSFASWDHARAGALVHRGAPLSQVVEALGPNGSWRGCSVSPDSFVSGVLKPEEVPQPLGKRAVFRAWSSSSFGGNYPLGWTEHEGRHKASGVRRVARLAPATGEGAADSSTG